MRFRELTRSTVGVGVAVMLAMCASMAIAQENAPPASTQPSKQPEAPPAPSLDELLGIGKEQSKEGDASGGDAAAKDNSDELKRKLNEAEVADAFEEAIHKMSLSADLLDGQFDTGLGTQRVQEDIIAKLALLIDQAKKQKSKSKSSSSSSSSSSQNQDQQNNPANAQAQKQNQPQPNDGTQRPPSADNSREGDPPAMQQGDVNKVIDETRSEWGNLPPRFRDMLLQGRREKKSKLYEQLTDEYYKRLAEEHAP